MSPVQAEGVSPTVGSAQDVHFNFDGTRMFVLDSGNEDVHEYHLSTAWDISSASYDSSFYVNSQETGANGLYFSSDGYNFMIVGSNSDQVHRYAMTTPWDVSTASFASDEVSVSSQDDFPVGLAFSPDGLNMYVGGGANDAIFQYSLSVPWDVSGASYASKSLDFTVDGNPGDLDFRHDGRYLYLLGTNGDDLYMYYLSVPWDVSTAELVETYDYSSEEPFATGVYVRQDGNRMYIVGQSSGPDEVNEYVLGFTDVGRVFLNNLGAVTDDRTVCANAATGELEFKSGTCSTSSLRFKEAIVDYTQSYSLSATDRLVRFNPVTFTRIPSVYGISDDVFENISDSERLPGGRTKRELGLIAEEVNEILPEAVILDDDGRVDSIDYPSLIPLLIQGFKEQEDRLRALEGRDPINPTVPIWERNISTGNQSNVSVFNITEGNFTANFTGNSTSNVSDTFSGNVTTNETGNVTLNETNATDNQTGNETESTSENQEVVIQDTVFTIPQEFQGNNVTIGNTTYELSQLSQEQLVSLVLYQQQEQEAISQRQDQLESQIAALTAAITAEGEGVTINLG
jgi:sugar lactone lactonase YvrE